MNWILYLYITAFVLLVAQIFLDYLVKVIFKDGRTTENKLLKKVLLVVTLAIVSVAFIKDQQTLRNSERKSGELIVKIETVDANQKHLMGEIQKLQGTIATNPSIDLKVRTAVFEASGQVEVLASDVVDLNAWKLRLEKKQSNAKIEEQLNSEKNREAKVRSEKEVFKQCSPMWDYTIKRFQSVLSEVAKFEGGKVVSSYNGLPELVSQTETIARISWSTNSAWDFDITITRGGNLDYDFPPHLVIVSRGNNSTLVVSPRFYAPGESSVAVQIANQPFVPPEKVSLNAFESVINEAVRDLIAGQSKSLEQKPK